MSKLAIIRQVGSSHDIRNYSAYWLLHHEWAIEMLYSQTVTLTLMKDMPPPVNSCCRVPHTAESTTLYCRWSHDAISFSKPLPKWPKLSFLL